MKNSIHFVWDRWKTEHIDVDFMSKVKKKKKLMFTKNHKFFFDHLQKNDQHRSNYDKIQNLNQNIVRK